MLLFRCLICQNENNLSVIPFSTIVKVFLEKKIIILHGTKCCSKHINLSVDNLFSFTSFEETFMTEEEITTFLTKISEEYKSSNELKDTAGKKMIIKT